ncbi:SH3 domain-containing protein [Planococcus glaciei]|uniref:SH3 domain-containing protein n=1 Tax=Planococcus glaciei TaxID=459472 RepID=UPI00088E8E4D|nr:SH3 domain-containing protein [Planococcus glaciei]SDI64751.1 SH3 domain-containing protein [Planococcus glaciei]
MAIKKSAKKIENYFINSQVEYSNIVIDLQKRFNIEVCEEIIAFVQTKTEESMELIWQKLKIRYDALSKLDQSFPNKPTKEDKNQYLKEFFRLTDPKQISKELQAALKFNELEKEYQKFIKKLKTQEFGKLFTRYVYPTHFFNKLKQSILQHVKLLINSLKKYTESIGNHAAVLEKIHQNSKDQAFIKGGAALLGMFVGIPFAGAGIGALMNGNDKTILESSMTKVLNQWNSYSEDFDKFMKTLEDNYRLAVMTIYGGTISRVNDQLNLYNYTFESMSLLSGHYTLTITEKESRAAEKWVKKTTFGIKQLILNKQWKESIKISGELFQIIKKQPILARSKLYEEKSTLYIAHKYYYLAFQEALLEEYKNGHKEQFFTTCKKLYQELPLLIQDKDIDSPFAKQGHLLFRFVKEGIENGKVEDLQVILDYWNRVYQRTQSTGIFIGEVGLSVNDIQNESKALLLVTNFLEEILGLKDRTADSPDEKRVYFSAKQIKGLQKIDKEIGKPDKLTQYLKDEYIKSIFLPWRNFPLEWILKKRQKLLVTILGVVILFSSFALGSEVYNSSNEKSSDNPTTIEKPSITYLTLTVEFANLRDSPTLDGAVITTVGKKDKIQYLNKDKTDSNGTQWHKVLLGNGKEGWISGAISTK